MPVERNWETLFKHTFSFSSFFGCSFKTCRDHSYAFYASEFLSVCQSVRICVGPVSTAEGELTFEFIRTNLEIRGPEHFFFFFTFSFFILTSTKTTNNNNNNKNPNKQTNKKSFANGCVFISRNM